MMNIISFTTILALTTPSLSQADTSISPSVPFPDAVITCCFGLNHQTRYLSCRLCAGEIFSPNQTVRIEGKHFENMTDADVNSITSGDVRLNLRYINGDLMNKFVNAENFRLRWLNVQGFGPNAFDSCARLELFEVRMGGIETLPRGMFRNCHNLRRFEMESTFIETLPSDLFGHTNNLEIFIFNRNRLTSLPDGIFQHMRNLRFVNLQINFITTLGSSLFTNLINLESINLSNNRIEDPNIVVNLLNGHNGLTNIDLANAGFSSFNFNFFAQFVRLQSLRISNTEREFLNIAWNGLPTSLVEFIMWQIGEEIPQNALHHLINLQHLRLSGQNIKNFHLHTFSPLVNLISLEILNCGLTTLHPELFSALNNLQNLDISFNQIEELPAGIFTNLVNLGRRNNVDSLYINRNRIRRLNANSFGVHRELKSVFASDNGLYEIERGIFGQCFPNITRFFTLDNACATGIIEHSFDDSLSLEYCFANWAGETTSTMTTTTDGCDGRKINLLIIFIGILLHFVNLPSSSQTTL